MYAITAQVETTIPSAAGPWQGSRQVPTFYLDETVQGITSEAHAERIAREILTTVLTGSGQRAPRMTVTAVKV
jgi:hypothetical protein